LDEYHRFWSSIIHNPTTSLAEIQKNSLFDFQRFTAACFFLGAGALVLANNIYGPILSIFLFLYNIIYRANPWIYNDQIDQKETWILFIKTLAIIGGALFMMTKGRLRSDEDVVVVQSSYKKVRAER
jgi:hypothetical protein